MRVINILLGECVDNSKIRVSCTPQNISVIAKGIERLKKLYPYGYCDERIVDFIVYQIYRYRDCINREPRWNITWCFSEMAVNKFRCQFIEEGGKSGMNWYIDRWLQESGTCRENLTGMLRDLSEHPLAKMIYVEAEDMMKKRFLNEEGGYFICQQSTTGWSPGSSVCAECNYVERCQITTEKKYPELFRIRKQWKKS